MLKLTWMAAGALFLTLWSRFRDDRLERKGKLTEVHDRLAFSVEGRERVGEGRVGTAAGRTARANRLHPTFLVENTNSPLGAHSGSPPSRPEDRSPI